VRPEEEFVKNSVINYLGGCIEAAAGEDPPDYYFTIDGVRVAVEVTQLVEASYDEHGRPKNRRTEDGFSANLCDQLNTQLGRYLPEGLALLLVIFGPIKVPRRFKKNLHQQVGKLVHDTGVTPGWERTYDIDGNKVRVHVVPQHSQSQKRITGLIENCDTTPFIKQNASVILASRINAKQAIMSKLSWSGPKWLCLLNDFWLADHETYAMALAEMTISHEFEKIFLVSLEGKIHVLYEKE